MVGVEGLACSRPLPHGEPPLAVEHQLNSNCFLLLSPPCLCVARTLGFVIRHRQAWAALGGGQMNTATGEYATVVGGKQNIALGDYSFAGGGYRSFALANYATVSGGLRNKANSRFATVVGGSSNTAGGRFSFAAGYMAIAPYDYSAAFAFGNPNSDDGKCVAPSKNSIQFCTEKFWMNGQDLVARIAEQRRLSEGVDSRLKAISAQATSIAEQDALLAEQRKQISSLQKVLAERQALIAQLSLAA
jgi:hypothetical protein